MNTAIRNPAPARPCPPVPDRLTHPLVMGTDPAWWPSTHTRPATAIPIRIRYSTSAMLTCARAVIRMPTMAMMSMMTPTATPMAIYAPVFVEVEPNTASTDGPSSSTSATVPMMYAATISHPVRKPRYGLIARPTHSNDAPQFAFHIFSRRYAFAMISIRIAVKIKNNPGPHDTPPPPTPHTPPRPPPHTPTVPAGADDPIPMTVSCATPTASGSSRARGAGAVPATVAAY